MARDVTTRITVYDAAFEEIKRSPDVYSFIRKRTDDAAEALRRSSPVRTGAGRGSIRSQVVMGPDGWTGYASWDEQHYYLGILNSRGDQSREGWADRAAATVRYV